MSDNEENDDIEMESHSNPLSNAELKSKNLSDELVFDLTKRKCVYWLSDYARQRVLRNQNFIVVVTGTTGSGKSYGGMELALDIDPSFDADRIVFDAKEFVRLVKSGLQPGSAIMWDEAGVGVSSRAWQSIQNKLIAFILETFRRDNLILIMTTPNMGFIDKKIRSLFHGYAETIDPTFTGRRFGFVRYFHIVVNLRKGNIMFMYPRVRDTSGRTKVVKGRNTMDGNMRFGKPPEWLSEPYEAKKLIFTESLKDTAMIALDNPEEEMMSKPDIRKFVEILTENPIKYGLASAHDIPLKDIVDKVFVTLCLEYPTAKVSKSLLTDSIKYVLSVNEFEFKKSGSILKDKDVFSVKNLLDIHKGKMAPVARTLNMKESTLYSTIDRWKKKGIWDPEPEEGDEEDEDKTSDKE